MVLGQVVALAGNEPAVPSDKQAFLSDVITMMKERYKFLQVPTTLEEHDFDKGVRFQRGWFNRTSIINKLEIYKNGLLCEAKLPTEQIDDFLSDFLTWANNEFGLPTPVGPRAYLSNMEFESDVGFGSKLNFASEIGTLITGMLRSYGQAPNPFQVGQFGLQQDHTNVPYPIASGFTLERRAGEPFSKNLYFSAAPLKTLDQLQVLEKLEAILA